MVHLQLNSSSTKAAVGKNIFVDSDVGALLVKIQSWQRYREGQGGPSRSGQWEEAENLRGGGPAQRDGGRSDWELASKFNVARW